MATAEWLEELLPGKWPPRVALLGFGLTASAASLPSLLPASFLPASPEQTFLLRVLLGVIAAAIAEVAVLVAVALHARQVQQEVGSWSVRIAVATLGVACPAGLIPFLLPAAVFSSLPERMLVLGIATALFAAVGIFIVLLLVARRIRYVAAQLNRSFWEVGS